MPRPKGSNWRRDRRRRRQARARKVADANAEYDRIHGPARVSNREVTMLCDCSCTDPCPLRQTGIAFRCDVLEVAARLECGVEELPARLKAWQAEERERLRAMFPVLED